MSHKIVQCAWCKKFFEKEMKRIKQTEKLDQQHTCSRSCSSKLANEKRRCEPTTIKAANVRRDKEKFPEKSHARYLVRKAIQTRKLIPVKQCELCGSDNRVEAHHPDYGRPFLIVYLCKNCHSLADREIDKWESLATERI